MLVRRGMILSLAVAGLAMTGARAERAPGLRDSLRRGGFNIYFRHSLTVRAGQPDDDLSSCARQRNLSESGRAVARDIGKAIRGHGIPIGRVLSSPYCRCLDTARLAFGSAMVADWLETNGDSSTADEQHRLRMLAAALSQRPASGVNDVYVAHGNNLAGLNRLLGWPSLPIAEADAVIFEPGYGAPPRVAARLSAAEWVQLG
ncbi:MAG: histidine phosphatase family protein [Alphaproteobacteria bacterium]|nr:histidine phosphatase family protein [Alphaproteobacteria bacterium]